MGDDAAGKNPPPVDPRRVTIVEVGPRDGLQNEPEIVGVAQKRSFVRSLAEAGLSRIEAASFVHPKWVPQMADAEEVFAGLPDEVGPRTRLSALVPNRKGLERAIAAGAREAAVVVSATEGFNRKNLNASVEETLTEIGLVLEAARREAIPVRGYVSVAFVCPYEGRVEPETAARVARRLLDAGAFEVAVSDTIGAATPAGVRRVLGALLPGADVSAVALHLHDTRGTALANVLAAYEMGIRVFDASAGGLGGCPFAPGALGNLATEDLVYLLDGMGIETGVALDRVIAASRGIESALGRPLPGRVFRAGGAPRPRG